MVHTYTLHRRCSAIVLRLHIALAMLVLPAAVASAQTPAPLRIATYNILNYGANESDRTPALRTVVDAMDPHVIVTQEIESAAGVALFLNGVLDPTFDGRFEAAPYMEVSNGDTEGAFFYDTTRVTYLGMEVIRTTLRGIFGYRFAVIGTTDTVWIYTLHLKASDSQEDAAQRASEARLLRRHLDSARAGQHVIVAGDFNIYRGTEEALTVLTSEQGNAAARLIDPLANTGNWHANRDFAFIHTQSPRVRSFGSGVNGGLDDRFDLILVSTSLSPVISRASYTAFGNDGNHFNDSINRPPNNAVSQEVAQALHDGSDHLPVYADFSFGVSSVTTETGALAVTVGPNPASSVMTFELPQGTLDGRLTVFDMRGERVGDIIVERGTSTVKWDCSAVPSGIYSWQLETSDGRAGGVAVVAR